MKWWRALCCWAPEGSSRFSCKETSGTQNISMNSSEVPSSIQPSGQSPLKQLESALALGVKNVVEAIQLLQEDESWEVNLAENCAHWWGNVVINCVCRLLYWTCFAAQCSVGSSRVISASKNRLAGGGVICSA